MITSRQITKISEEWLKSGSGYGSKHFDIYVNPGSSDIKDILKAIGSHMKLVRFIADANNSKIYVVDGNSAIHDDITKSLGIGSVNSLWYINSNILSGEANISNGRFTLNKVDKYSQGCSLERLSDLDYFLSGLPMSSVKSMKDDLMKKYKWLKSIFDKNWTFVDRYVSGFNSYMANEKSLFTNFEKKFLSVK